MLHKKDFVLVHGAWHPSSCWGKTQQYLEQWGHRTYSIQLAGLGNDKTIPGQVKLSDHVIAVIEKVNQVFEANGEPVVLLGHSYGGVVISQAAQYLEEKVRSLVYLSGILLNSGECVIELYNYGGFEESVIARYHELDKERGVITLPEEITIPGFFNQTERDSGYFLRREVNHLISGLRPQPYQTFVDRLNLYPSFAKIPKIYIECLRDRAVPVQTQRSMYRQFKMEKVYTIDTDHSPYVTDPLLLISVLRQISSSAKLS